MTERIAMWGDYTRGAVDPWVTKNCTMQRILVHIDNPTPDAVAEFFTAPNHKRLTLADMMRRYHLRPWLCLDWHYGTGRMEDTGSPVRPGRYHYDSAEGGVIEALRQMLKWAPGDALIQLGNEQKVPSSWYADVCRQAKGMIGNRLLIVGGSRENIGAALPSADGIDVHLLRTADRVRLMEALSTKLPVYVSELSPPLDVDTLSVRQRTYNQWLRDLESRDQVRGVGCFVGNDVDYPDTPTVRWNFRQLYQFLCNTNGGETWIGEEYREVMIGNELDPDPGEEEVMTKDQVEALLARWERRQDRLLERIDNSDGDRRRLRGRVDESQRCITDLEEVSGVDG